ncbi:COX15/CtaA family protein [Vibrio sp. CAU 1672]|uniref:COX15/CtaA family protein n=1 Tax=Vibrio sp. CAU 1672 TaxID=3032594 RepID=UPI0023DAA0B0|nr:COX15/CtaA family protein [Vibrio sp. CAU 1672]MDF2152731.1 COX15/CtaA family protein [Vibrio sp. CAU 1672]
MALRHLVKISLCLTFIVIMLGAYTRLADAGLGCPDWPGCYGHYAVPQSDSALEVAKARFPQHTIEPEKAWLEMVHRYFAGTLGLLIFLITIVAVKTPRTNPVIPLVLCIIVIGQALLGMWTVTLKLMPVIVMLHLLGGYTLLVLQAVFYCQLNAVGNHSFSPSSASPGLMRLFSALVFVVVLVQILLGGWTSSNYAALMCTSLPICQGDWTEHLSWREAFSFWQTGFDNYEFGVLDYSARMTIHVSHRFGAMITAVFVLCYCWLLVKQRLYQIRKTGLWLAAILVCQIVLGVSNVVFHLPIYVAVAHNLGAAVMFTLVGISLYYLWQGEAQAIFKAKGVRYE